MSHFITHAADATPTFPVGEADHDDTNAWLNELPALLWRYAGMGIDQDVGQMDLVELHGLYRYLARIQRQSRT